jgi:DNA topoisomerase VI subunit B
MTQILERDTFTVSRDFQFFTEKGLTMQIGQPKHCWPAAILKELLDNALDACEGAGKKPDIRIAVEDDALVVEDNGPGIPPAVVEKSMDYRVNVSNKVNYVGPTRGQLGNALKCAWAASLLADGACGQAEVTARGVTSHVRLTLDRIGQEPRPEYRTESAVVKNGTILRLRWPRIA